MHKLLILPFLLLGLMPLQALTAQHPSCKPGKIDSWTYARIANSGNQITINNSQFQITGTYAPEMGNPTKRNEPTMPLAKQAQAHLNRLLANNKMRVGIQFDKDKKDAFGRAIAYFFLEDGTNLGAAMLQAGFALHYITPPNSTYLECYTHSENEARAKRKGLWEFSQKFPQVKYPLAISSNLSTEDQGFRIIQGEVRSVSRSKNNYIVNLDTTGIRIQKKFWKHFDFRELQALKGETIEIRGYAFAHQGAMYVVTHHPSAIDKLNKYDK